MTKRELLNPSSVYGPDAHFTPGIRYGRWAFVSAINASDYDAGLVPEVRGNEAVPLSGEDRGFREAKYILGTIERILAEAGTNIQNSVRIDQFPTSREAMDPYHLVRRDFIHPPRPASTSVGVSALKSPEVSIQAEVLAAIPEAGFEKEGVETDAIPRPLAGYSPAIRIGDFVFLAGQIPTDFKTGIAPEAAVNPTFWEGNRIDRETRYTLKNMAMTLQAAGSSLENVVKAQVYLTHIEDIPRFERVWAEFFPVDPPARTIYPVTGWGLGALGSRIEINFVALVDGGRTKKEVIEAPGLRKPLFNAPHAVRAGEFLFLSGLLAADEEGLVKSAQTSRGSPYIRDTAAAQMDDIMEQADAICRAAGTSLSNALRLLTVFTDLHEYPSATRARAAHFPDGQPVTTNIEVPAPLQVAGCTLLADLWVATAA